MFGVNEMFRDNAGNRYELLGEADYVVNEYGLKHFVELRKYYDRKGYCLAAIDDESYREYYKQDYPTETKACDSIPMFIGKLIELNR